MTHNLPFVHLRAIEPEDLDALYAIENDMSQWNVGLTSVPYSRYTLYDYIANAKNDIYTDRQVRMMIEDEGGGMAGIVDLINFDPKHLRAEVGIVVRNEYRGRGLAQATMAKVCDYALHVLHLHQLYAYVPQENEASRRLFCSAGFRETAVLDDWIWREGRYVPVVLLQKIQLR